MKDCTRIYGDSRAVWYRPSDGAYFDGSGKRITAEDAAKPGEAKEEAAPPPPDPTALPHYEQSPDQKSDVVINASHPDVAVDADEAHSDAVKPDLDKMNAKALAKLVRIAGGEPAQGAGEREKNLAWLRERYE